MGPTPGKIEGVLPNLGLGLRIEVQPRMNVRLDFGRDMVNKQNLFYFNMTEAFDAIYATNCAQFTRKIVK